MIDSLIVDEDITAIEKEIATNPQAYEPRRRLAWELCARGRLEEGIKAFTDVIGRNDSDPQNYAILGETFLRLGKPSEALIPLQRAVQLAPNYCFALYNLGRAHEILDNQNEAEKYFLQAFAARTEMKPPYEGHLAYVADKEGNIEAIEGYPTIVQLVQCTALFYIRLGNYEKALETVSKGIELQKSEPAFIILAGQIFAAMEKHNQAARVYQEYIKLVPSQGIAYRLLAGSLRALGRLDEAIENYREAIRLSPEDVDAHFELGTIFSKTERLEEAKIAYSEALRLAPEDAMCNYNLGCLCMKLGDFKKAVELFRYAVTKSPNDARFFHNLGISLRNLGKSEEAVTALKEAVRLKPEFDLAWRDLGVAYSRMGLFQEAIAAYEKAIAINPNYSTVYFDAGLDHAQSGNFPEALNAFAKVTQLTPEYRAAWVEHFFCAILANRPDLAEKDLEAIPELLTMKWNSFLEIPSKACASPLHVAAYAGFPEIVTWLLERGAQVNFGGKEKTTPLCIAKEYGSVQVEEILTARGGKMECPNP